MGVRSSTVDGLGRPGFGLGSAQRLAAIAALCFATVATWELVFPAVDTGQDQSAVPPRVAAPAPEPIKGVGGVYIAVLNVTGTNGAANAAAASLKARGVHVSYVGNGIFTNNPTAVLYRSGAKRPAQALATALHLPAPKPCQPALAPSIGVAQVIVLVGPTGVRG